MYCPEEKKKITRCFQIIDLLTKLILGLKIQTIYSIFVIKNGDNVLWGFPSGDSGKEPTC